MSFPAGTRALFPEAPARAGLYESFYLRAVAPDRPAGVWIRHTVHKPPGRAPRGSVWCTMWDGEAPPYMHKLTTDALAAPAGAWIAAGDSRIGPDGAEGACGQARWSLRFACEEPPLRHLPHAWMYRAPLPRTKLTSPLPAARFEGTLHLPPRAPSPPGDSPALRAAVPSQPEAGFLPTMPHPGVAGAASRVIALDGWHGMVGHNWGAQHAERWVWLHGVDFAEQPGTWIDVAIGRVRVAGRTTPWVANGAMRLDGERLRLGGLGARGLLVAERPERCVLALPGAGGLLVEAHVRAPAAALAGWRYADPVGERRGRDVSNHEHDVSNCSVAALTLVVRRPGRPARTLRTAYGAAYELGMREHDHGVPLAPFGDG